MKNNRNEGKDNMYDRIEYDQWVLIGNGEGIIFEGISLVRKNEEIVYFITENSGVSVLGRRKGDNFFVKFQKDEETIKKKGETMEEFTVAIDDSKVSGLIVNKQVVLAEEAREEIRKAKDEVVLMCNAGKEKEIKEAVEKAKQEIFSKMCHRPRECLSCSLQACRMNECGILKRIIQCKKCKHGMQFPHPRYELWACSESMVTGVAIKAGITKDVIEFHYGNYSCGFGEER